MSDVSASGGESRPPEEPARRAERDEIDALKTALAALAGEEQRLPPLLFHYTSAQSFLGVLTSDAMWASHARYLNDPSELVYASGLIEAALGRWERRCGESSRRVMQTTCHMLTHLGETDALFAASFSEVGDLLSQWRGYGDFGGGYAVGVRAAELDLAGKLAGVTLRPVVYERQAQTRIVEQTLARFCGEEQAGGGPAERARARDLHARLAMQAIFFKHSSFSEEREWRAVAVVDHASAPDLVSFRPAGGVIVPFVELDMRGGTRTRPERIPLGKIVCGPTLQPDLSRRAVRMALLAHRHPDCEVQVSKVPLRRREV
jgi:hypothetical protein